MGSNGKKNLPPSNVPLIRPMIDVTCWICEQTFKAPVEAKMAKRIVCGKCAQEFDQFLWSLYRQAYQARKALEKAKEISDNYDAPETGE